MDPRILIRIHTKMSWIRNTAALLWLDVHYRVIQPKKMHSFVVRERYRRWHVVKKNPRIIIIWLCIFNMLVNRGEVTMHFRSNFVCELNKETVNLYVKMISIQSSNACLKNTLL
jgi:hypothetical protein